MLEGLGQLHGVFRGGKQAGRELSDFASAFGLPAGCPASYRQFVQMTLNLDRVRVARAVSVAMGIQAASSDEPLDDIWGDAIASAPEEGAEIAYEANKERARSRSARKLGPTGPMGG